MSNTTNFSCRDKYYNYGSYLRSRGYDSEFCKLVNDIESGKVHIGPIVPGNCPNATTTINNSVTINPCPTLVNSGVLKVTGGDIGDSTDNNTSSSTFLTNSANFSIQSNAGIRNLGPIVQITDCSHSNYFSAGGHVFTGGNGGIDCSTNVTIEGGLNVSGPVNITQNPIATNTVDGTTRTLTNFSESITVIDTSSNATYIQGSHDISFDNIVYSNIDNSSVIFANNIIDFSNNQEYVKDSILEVYYSVPANFTNQADALTVSFKDVNGSDRLYLDTRSIKGQLGQRTIGFGPQTFVFTNGSPDISYIGKQWTLEYDISGGNITTENGRLTIKQKSLI